MKKREPIDNTKPRDWYESMPWAIIRTEPQREVTLTARLIGEGIPAFCPQEKKQHNKRGSTYTRLHPIFRGYNFVLLGNHVDRWSRVRRLPGFLSFLHTGGPQSPVACVDGDAISALGEQELQLSTKIKNPFSQYGLGQSVRFASGPFEGLLARIVAIEPNKRISVLRELFGRETIVKVTANEIEAA